MVRTGAAYSEAQGCETLQQKLRVLPRSTVDLDDDEPGPGETPDMVAREHLVLRALDVHLAEVDGLGPHLRVGHVIEGPQWHHLFRSGRRGQGSERVPRAAPTERTAQRTWLACNARVDHADRAVSGEVRQEVLPQANHRVRIELHGDDGIQAVAQHAKEQGEATDVRADVEHRQGVRQRQRLEELAVHGARETASDRCDVPSRAVHGDLERADAIDRETRAGVDDAIDRKQPPVVESEHFAKAGDLLPGACGEAVEEWKGHEEAGTPKRSPYPPAAHSAEQASLVLSTPAYARLDRRWSTHEGGRSDDEAQRSDGMTDILAVSMACCTAINRVIFRELMALGWSVELAIPGNVKIGAFARESDPAMPGDPIIHRQSLAGSAPRSWRQRGLINICERLRPKIVLLDNDPGSVEAAELGAWARLRRSHLVCVSCENMPRAPIYDALRGDFRRAARSLAVTSMWSATRPLVDAVFVINRDGFGIMRSKGFRSVSQIPLGFDERLFRPDPAMREVTRNRLGLLGPVVAYFGRLVREKGVHLMIEALSRLRDRPWQLLIDDFGTYTDPYAEEVQRLIDALGLGSRVVRFDAKHEEMPAYMNASDIVVIPSISTPRWKEQYGRVLPEAMACGCAVVASDSGALPELVGDAGLIFPQGNVGAIVSCLASLLDDDSRRRALGESGALRARRHLGVQSQRDIMHEQFMRFAAPREAGHSE
jgi:glycosyltransferase involved in cell wall biosynthesis